MLNVRAFSNTVAEQWGSEEVPWVWIPAQHSTSFVTWASHSIFQPSVPSLRDNNSVYLIKLLGGLTEWDQACKAQ